MKRATAIQLLNVQPFAVYQTLRGPVSMGVYFRCQAEDVLLAAGDDKKQPRWVAVTELAVLLERDAEAFRPGRVKVLCSSYAPVVEHC